MIMAKISFNDLPSELIFEITKNLHDWNDLNSLIRSCKQLATCLTPQLYDKPFSPIEINAYKDIIYSYMRNNHDENPLTSTIAAQQLYKPAKHWGSEYVLSYFTNIPLEWINRVQFITNADVRVHKQLLEMITRAGNIRLLKILLDRGIDVETRGHHYNTPLHTASEAHLLDTVRLLLSSGADILARDGEGMTALSLAISEDHSAVALLLLDADRDGRTVNVPRVTHVHGLGDNDTGMTPLHYATRSNNSVALAQRLLDKGANMFAKSGGYSISTRLDDFHDYSKMTPLDMAIYRRKDQMAFLLVDRMLAMPKELSELGPAWGDGKPLFIAMHSCFWPMVHRLVEEGIEIKDSMEVAIREGAEPILDFLNEIGPDVWPSTIINVTFGFVCEDKNLEGLKMIFSLIEKGKLHAEISELDEQLPLNLIVNDPHVRMWAPEMVRLLLDKGASAETKRFGWTPLRLTLVGFRGKSEGPLFDVIKLLINAGTDFTFTNYRGVNYLHQVAVQKSAPTDAAGEITIMNLFLSKGIDINSRTENKSTALHLVAARGRDCKEELISFLLSKGADPNMKNRKKETPLTILLLKGGSLQSVILLVRAGADLSARSGKNQPLIHYAAAAQRDDVVKFFLESGAERHMKCEVCLKGIEKVMGPRRGTAEPSIPENSGSTVSEGSTENDTAEMEAAHWHNWWERPTNPTFQ